MVEWSFKGRIVVADPCDDQVSTQLESEPGELEHEWPTVERVAFVD